MSSTPPPPTPSKVLTFALLLSQSGTHTHTLLFYLIEWWNNWFIYGSVKRVTSLNHKHLPIYTAMHWYSRKQHSKEKKMLKLNWGELLAPPTTCCTNSFQPFRGLVSTFQSTLSASLELLVCCRSAMQCVLENSPRFYIRREVSGGW